MSYAWKEKSHHINVLEMVAVLDLLRKLARSPKGHQLRMIVLVDNQVALSVLTKGPTLGPGSAIPTSPSGRSLLGIRARCLLRLGKIKMEPSGWPIAMG